MQFSFQCFESLFKSITKVSIISKKNVNFASQNEKQYKKHQYYEQLHFQ